MNNRVPQVIQPNLDVQIGPHPSGSAVIVRFVVQSLKLEALIPEHQCEQFCTAILEARKRLPKVVLATKVPNA